MLAVTVSTSERFCIRRPQQNQMPAHTSERVLYHIEVRTLNASCMIGELTSSYFLVCLLNRFPYIHWICWNLLSLHPALRTLTSDYNCLKRQVQEFPFMLEKAISEAKQEVRERGDKSHFRKKNKTCLQP